MMMLSRYPSCRSLLRSSHPNHSQILRVTRDSLREVAAAEAEAAAAERQPEGPQEGPQEELFVDQHTITDDQLTTLLHHTVVQEKLIERPTERQLSEELRQSREQPLREEPSREELPREEPRLDQPPPSTDVP